MCIRDRKIYFYNLPKYDANSDIVRYDIREVWIEDGTEEERTIAATFINRQDTEREIVTVSGPVSYTHLDVYKRQSQS